MAKIISAALCNYTPIYGHQTDRLTDGCLALAAKRFLWPIAMASQLTSQPAIANTASPIAQSRFLRSEISQAQKRLPWDSHSGLSWHQLRYKTWLLCQQLVTISICIRKRPLERHSFPPIIPWSLIKLNVPGSLCSVQCRTMESPKIVIQEHHKLPFIRRRFRSRHFKKPQFAYKSSLSPVIGLLTATLKKSLVFIQRRSHQEK